MWKLIFNNETNRCTGCNREPLEGEFTKDLPPSECAWANVYPERYMLFGDKIVELPEWEEENLRKETLAKNEAEIRATYEVESEAPVEVNGITWNGGQDSAGYIQGAVSLAQALGESNVIITDINNVAHELSFTDAMTVAVMVGKSFRDAFLKKQSALINL